MCVGDAKGCERIFFAGTIAKIYTHTVEIYILIKHIAVTDKVACNVCLEIHTLTHT